jgi:hypothetical protein
VGDLFEIADAASKQNLEIAEFRFSRVENSPGFLVLTGGTGASELEVRSAADGIIARLGRDISCTIIDGVNEGYTQFFSSAVLS